MRQRVLSCRPHPEKTQSPLSGGFEFEGLVPFHLGDSTTKGIVPDVACTYGLAESNHIVGSALANEHHPPGFRLHQTGACVSNEPDPVRVDSARQVSSGEPDCVSAC